MKRIGILSFHGAHNYGSMLQNYALQQAVRSISNDLDPVTINLRNEAQDDMYNIFKPLREYTDKKRYLFKIIMTPWRREIEEKQRLFEEFLSDNVSLTHEVKNSGEISELPVFDAYITGSDQIWNFGAHDFDWAYFLDFISNVPEEKTRRIAYAPSMGPAPSVASLNETKRIRALQLIRKFDEISVREEKTADAVMQLSGMGNRPEICPDPTLLLTPEKWRKLKSGSAPIEKGKYIFLYNPYYLKEVYDQAHKLKEITGLPVVTTTLAPKTILPSKGFRKRLATGPREFLNFVDNAEYVIGRSFHLAVFSLLFEKKFIAVNGMGDSRLGNFLNLTGMQKCASGGKDLGYIVDNLEFIDFADCRHAISQLREKGFDFLKRNLATL